MALLGRGKESLSFLQEYTQEGFAICSWLHYPMHRNSPSYLSRGFLMIAELEAVIIAFCLAVTGVFWFLEILHGWGIDLNLILMPVYLVSVGFIGFIQILFSILLDLLVVL